MLEEDLCICAYKLAEYIRHKKFKPVTQRTPYKHMGATIVDSILQAGLNYRYVVYPRVLKLLTEFPDYKTTCDFIILMQTVPLDQLIKWNNQEKLRRIRDLTWFLYENGIENEDALASWFVSDDPNERLKSIHGIGPKTVDYLRMLSGCQAIAIDRHLFAFLELAGILNCTYQEASIIYNKSSELLHMSKYEIDKSIWQYMSQTQIG